MYQKFLILCLILFNTLGCQNPHDDGDNSSILAEAFGEQLHISEVSDRLKNIQSASDSQFVINQYTDQWVMDKILYQEAKRTIGKDKGINKLVENYKKSLIIHEWEKTILTEKMDTLLSQNEIDTFYSQRKKDFKLQEDVIRFLFIKVPIEIDNETLKDLWKTEELPALKKYISDGKGLYILDPDTWYYKSELKNLMPQGLYKKIVFSKLENYSYKEDETKFFVKILEIAKTGNDAPVSLVEETIRERILHDRAQDILKKTKEEIYNNNIQNKVIQYHTKSDKE